MAGHRWVVGRPTPQQRPWLGWPSLRGAVAFSPVLEETPCSVLGTNAALFSELDGLGFVWAAPRSCGCDKGPFSSLVQSQTVLTGIPLDGAATG